MGRVNCTNADLTQTNQADNVMCYVKSSEETTCGLHSLSNETKLPASSYVCSKQQSLSLVKWICICKLPT